MKWADGDTTDYSPKDMYVEPDGAVILDTSSAMPCNCAGLEAGYGHEMHCRQEFLGFIDGSEPVKMHDNPEFLWSSFWDFSQV